LFGIRDLFNYGVSNALETISKAIQYPYAFAGHSWAIGFP